MTSTLTQFDTPRNHLLSAVPDDEVDLVLSMLEPVELSFGQTLVEADRAIEHVYFPENALVTTLGSDNGSTTVEVSMIGRDGMVGLPIFLGVDRTQLRAQVQIAGAGWRMTAEHLRALAYQSETVERLLRRYAHASYFFAAQSSACHRLHNVMQRCARWLLTTQDLVGSAQFRVTHLVLAQMLGVRRATVTETAGVLQRDGLISYNRGSVRIVDRNGLEKVSCSCYEVIRREQERAVPASDGARAMSARVATGARSVTEGASSHVRE